MPHIWQVYVKSAVCKWLTHRETFPRAELHPSHVHRFAWRIPTEAIQLAAAPLQALLQSRRFEVDHETASAIASVCMYLQSLRTYKCIAFLTVLPEMDIELEADQLPRSFNVLAFLSKDLRRRGNFLLETTTSG